MAIWLQWIARQNRTVGRERLEVHLLGRSAVLRGGVEVRATAFGGRKARRLLRFLATERGGIVPQDRLADALWGDNPPADPAGNLSVLVTRVRAAVGDPSSIVTGDGGYALGTDVVVDAEEFAAAVDRARACRDGDRTAALTAYREAFARWSGDPLPEDVDEEWAAVWRRDLLRRRQEALEDAAALALELGEPTLAQQYAQAAIAADRFREAGYLISARASAASGAAAAGLEVLAALTRLLAEELGLDPSPQVEAVRAEVLGAGSSAPTVARGAASPHRRPPPAATADAGQLLPLLARDDVLAAVTAATAVRPDGRAGVAVLAAEAGAGKSRVLAEWTAGHDRGVVAVRAFLPGRADALALVRTFLRCLLDVDAGLRGVLTGPAATAVGTVLLDTEPAAPAFDQETLHVLLVDAGTRLLRSGDCRAVVVDDLQWSDPTSLRVLAAVLDQVDEAGCIVAVRPSEVSDGSPAARFLADLGARRRVDHVDLPPLSAADLAAVLEPELADLLAQASGGNAFAVVDLLRGLADGGLVRRAGRGWATAAPPAGQALALRQAVHDLAALGLRRTFRTRLRRQAAAARDLLVVLSVLARPAAPRTLAACLGHPVPEVLDQLAALHRADLVRRTDAGWVTSHDLVRESVAAELPDAERARAHGRTAAALAAEDGDSAEIAHHLAGSGDADAAAERFAAAAETLVESAADAEAAQLVEAGLGCASRGDAQRRLLGLRSRLHARHGDAAAARRDLTAALDGCPAGPRRAALLTDQAMLHLGADDVRRAATLVDLALVEASDDGRVRARALEVASVVDMNLDLRDRAADRADRAYALYVASGDGLGAARVLDARAMATFLDGRIGDATDEFRRVSDLFRSCGALLRAVTPWSTLGHALVFAGRAADGLVETRAALDLARTLGHDEGRTYALWHTAEALAGLGRHDDATAAAREALDIAVALGHRGWTATAWRATGIAHQTAGRLDDAEHAFGRSLAQAHGFSLFTSWAASRLALVLVAQGGPAQAAHHLSLATSEGPRLARYESDLAAAEVAVAVGDLRGRDLARAALDRARQGGHLVSVPRLLVLGA